MSQFASLVLLLFMPFFATEVSESVVTKKECKEILSYLSSDELGGRGIGQEGNKKAALFIANEFKQYGLEPIDPPVTIQPVPLPPSPDGHGYFQDFDYSYTARSGLFRRRTINIKTSNVVGILRGESDDCILFGAHFDHLGTKGGNIYNGADDNASGTTALLELAEAFAQCGRKPKYTLIFAAFSAEEVGLIGSRFYVKHPALPLNKHVVMINMDMVGRLKAFTTLNLYSDNLTGGMKSIVRKIEKKYPFDFSFVPAGSRSDHAPFSWKGIPVLFFHTGTHPQYHQPTDDEHLINYDGIVQITNFIIEFILEFENDG